MSQLSGDDLVVDLLRRAQRIKLPPPKVPPHFVLARVGRRREQKTAFLAGFAGALASVLACLPLVRHQWAAHQESAVVVTRESKGLSGQRSAGPSPGPPGNCPAQRVTDHGGNRFLPPARPSRPHRPDKTQSLGVQALLSKAQDAQKDGDCVRVGQLLERAHALGASEKETADLGECGSQGPRPTRSPIDSFGGRK